MPIFLSAPESGTVGQYFRISAVDENGRITGVEAVDAPTGGSVDEDTVQQIVDDYLEENPPVAGADGENGLTPHIGQNGNWYIGDTDTGVQAHGKDGDTGPQGPQGETGPAGSDGYTPVKGKDYYTEPDKMEIVGLVKDAMPTLTVTGIDADGVSHSWIMYGVAQ